MMDAPLLPSEVVVAEAGLEDAPAIAEIHLAARREAMPYLRLAHTDDETRAYFAGAVGDRPSAWWVVRHRGQVVAYMLIDGEELDHLYVAPAYQRQGFGSALLANSAITSWPPTSIC